MGEQISYLGPRGTFSEEAALTWMKGEKGLSLLPLPSMEEVMQSVEEGKATMGVLPLENSREGSVGLTLDLLTETKKVKIKGEVVIPVKHYLFVPPGLEKTEIKEIYSHPQALSQCHRFLQEHLPEAKEIPRFSTAGAVAEVASLGGSRAALGPYRSGEIYGLRPLLSALSEKDCNQTRFVFLGQEDAPPSAKDKTSLVFTVGTGPGRLYQVLELFAKKNINLTKIESRPAKKNMGEYIFFVDFEGHRLQTESILVLKKVAEMVPFMKVLGSYPAFAG